MSKVSVRSVAMMLAVLAATKSSRVDAGPMPAPDLKTLVTPLYQVQGGSFVRQNGDRFNNRPLYLNQTSGAVLGGDKPLIRLGRGGYHFGALLLGVKRGESVKWLIDCDDVVMTYDPGRLRWVVRDASFPGLAVTVDLLPAGEGTGLSARISAEGAKAGDQLVWCCGAVVKEPKEAFLWAWDVTTGGREKTMLRSLNPEDAAGNVVTLKTGGFQISSSAGDDSAVLTGRTSTGGAQHVGDATAWRDPAKLLAGALPRAATAEKPAAPDKPVAIGLEPLGETPIYAVLNGRLPASVSKGQVEPAALDPQAAFAAAELRFSTIRAHLTIKTPDPRLDAAMLANLTVTDAVYRDGIFTHAGMRWGVPLVGWRSIYSATTYGWIERVKTQARTLFAAQVQTSEKLTPMSDPKLKLTREAPGSRMFGKGRIALYQPLHYDMQSQFFDQAIHAWRWTGDAELETMLRPALELHLEWLQDCFDPDNDGAYESYTNSWPTDHTWFSGGGTSEQTAYAYAGHKAARDLARRAGDKNAEQRHQAKLDHIAKGFFEQMWAKESGHPGAVREQAGHRRLREDAWLYAIFCPIDAGMLDPVQSVQALNYSRWALERIKLPYGGEQVWPSNWVPNVWSVREMWPGDNYHLALAHFQTGLPDEGWEILRGTFPQYLLYGPVPGDQGHGAGGTDFNDCAGMFGRTVIEGLFGFRPDYPNDLVTVAPQLPSDWNEATIRTPDFSLAIARGPGKTDYVIGLTRPAPLKVCVPVAATKVTSVTVDGQPAKYEIRPGFGVSTVEISLTQGSGGKIAVTYDGTHTPVQIPTLAVKVGDKLDLPSEGAVAGRLTDPQGALSDGKVAPKKGNKVLVSDVKVGELPQWRATRLTVSDPAADAVERARYVDKVPADARFEVIDMSATFNGDIRTIFQQEYLSPRPATVSLRLGTDGFSSWQMTLDPKFKLPEIGLDNVPKLTDERGRLTALGAKFNSPAPGRNVAFTSMWDNWPRSVEVPVNKSGDAVWLLVCGSTFPMHTRIANGVIVLTYADGTTDRLDLVPPLNYWSLCAYHRADYNYTRDGFTLPPTPPPQVQLGPNCRAMVLNLKLKPGVELRSVKLETLSSEVVIGLMGISVMNPR